MSEAVYIIEATADTPLFTIDKIKHLVKIQGISMPENAFEFYDPIEKMMLRSYGEYKGPVTIEIEVSYMNSMSNKQLLKLIKQLSSKNNQLNVVWKYAKNDLLMKLKGEEIAFLCAPLKIITEEVA